MKEVLTEIFTLVFTAIISFTFVCLGVLFFAIQFGFEWSFLLCVCIWMALIAARWIMQGARNE